MKGRHYAREGLQGKVPGMTHSRSRALPLLSLFCFGLWTFGHNSEAWSQRAAYVVQSKADIDGDGRADEVRLDDMGTITVHIAGRPKAGAWTALAAAGKIVGGSIAVDRKLDPKSRTIIVANSKLRTGSGLDPLAGARWQHRQ
jgi:hypothetical protein